MQSKPSMKPTMRTFVKWSGACSALGTLGLLVMSCSSSSSDVVGIMGGSPAGGALETQTPDAATDAAIDTVKQCVATECPPPRATCPGSALCTVDTSTDPNNCGGCGIVCPNLSNYNLFERSACVGGACAVACVEDHGDCDGKQENGCEVELLRYESIVLPVSKDCGTCGNDCHDEPCVEGHCGCPADKPDLCPPGVCVDTSRDLANCGSCGHVCEDCPHMPPHTNTNCADRKCSLQCDFKKLDCDNDLSKGCATRDGGAGDAGLSTESNGCETDMGKENCGACGRVCPPPSVCIEGQFSFSCSPPEGVPCPPGLASCGERCVDLERDAEHCGDCGVSCLTTDGYTARTCQRGVCVPTCSAGWADCDGDTICETNLLDDVNNCGDCNVQCDYGLGQPCIRGRCLTVPCPDAGKEIPR